MRERLNKFEPELADTSRIVFSSATYETNVSSKTVDMTPEVNGRMVYGKYHISVSFDKDGNVTALTQQYAPLKEGGTKTVRLADAKTVQARLDAHEFSANIAQELTDCTITGFEQAYYMNAGFNTEGDYSLYPIYVLRGQGTAADGSVRPSSARCLRSRMTKLTERLGARVFPAGALCGRVGCSSPGGERRRA